MLCHRADKEDSRLAQYIESEFIGINSRRENFHFLFPQCNPFE